MRAISVSTHFRHAIGMKTRVAKQFNQCPRPLHKQPDIDRIGELLRLKSFVVTADFDLTTHAKAARDLPQLIATTLAAAVPLNAWLRAAPAI